MAEYIDRDKALGCFHDWVDKNGWVYEACDIPEYQEIENLPAADVVEVVRCKDCIYFDKDYDEDTADWCHAWSETTREDGYCHNAERGEQE